MSSLNNFKIWLQRTEQRGKRLASSHKKLEVFSQGMSIGMALALLGPSFALICYLPSLHRFDFTSLAIIVVALPRLFQVLSYSYELLFIMADFPMQKSRMSTIRRFLDPEKRVDQEQALNQMKMRVQWERIQVTHNSAIISSKKLLESIPRTGRYTLRGENGSGKSSFLLILKLLKGTDSLYLPPKHELVFKGSKRSLSTGQRVRKSLEEILAEHQTAFILLDEWDANLDPSNRQYLSNLIDELSKNKCVVETLHSHHVESLAAKQ